MKEVRDMGILLFGKKIALPVKSPLHIAGEFNCDVKEMEYKHVEETEQGHLLRPHGKSKTEEMTELSANSKACLELEDNPKTLSIDDESAAAKDENDQSDTTNSDQKILKKPDKILPCPRCNSMDTKFCYYNNYNISQPRHFCKSCQRYWTAGGTMRNVPVGAGRRKTKNSASHCRYLTISEALHAAQFDSPDVIHNPANKSDGKILTFGSDSTLFGSVASALKLSDQKASQVDDCSSGSSVTTSNSMAESNMQNIHAFPSQVPCLPPGVAWPYPWNHAVPMPGPWNPAVPMPGLCPPGLQLPFYPSPYWNCSVPGAWTIPWLPHLSNERSHGSESSSPHLGKHPREGESRKPNNTGEEQKKHKNSVLVPKTLRIDDPDEAAKSSIWATLGIKNDSINREGLFKAFQAKGEEKNHRVTNSPLLQANPAALSRSLCFQERA